MNSKPKEQTTITAIPKGGKIKTNNKISEEED